MNDKHDPVAGKINFVELAIKEAGGVTAVARHFSIRPFAVKKWILNRLPAERVLDLEHLSGISREKLRSDLYPSTRSYRRFNDQVRT